MKCHICNYTEISPLVANIDGSFWCNSHHIICEICASKYQFVCPDCKGHVFFVSWGTKTNFYNSPGKSDVSENYSQSFMGINKPNAETVFSIQNIEDSSPSCNINNADSKSIGKTTSKISIICSDEACNVNNEGKTSSSIFVNALQNYDQTTETDENNGEIANKVKLNRLGESKHYNSPEDSSSRSYSDEKSCESDEQENSATSFFEDISLYDSDDSGTSEENSMDSPDLTSKECLLPTSGEERNSVFSTNAIDCNCSEELSIMQHLTCPDATSSFEDISLSDSHDSGESEENLMDSPDFTSKECLLATSGEERNSVFSTNAIDCNSSEELSIMQHLVTCPDAQCAKSISLRDFCEHLRVEHSKVAQQHSLISEQITTEIDIAQVYENKPYLCSVVLVKGKVFELGSTKYDEILPVFLMAMRMDSTLKEFQPDLNTKSVITKEPCMIIKRGRQHQMTRRQRQQQFLKRKYSLIAKSHYIQTLSPIPEEPETDSLLLWLSTIVPENEVVLGQLTVKDIENNFNRSWDGELLNARKSQTTVNKTKMRIQLDQHELEALTENGEKPLKCDVIINKYK